MQMASSVLKSSSNIAKHYNPLSAAQLCRKYFNNWHEKERSTYKHCTQTKMYTETDMEKQSRRDSLGTHKKRQKVMYMVQNCLIYSLTQTDSVILYTTLRVGGWETQREIWDRQSEPTSQRQTVTKQDRHTELGQSYKQIHSLGSLETGLSSMTLSMRTIILRSNKIWPLNMAGTVIKDNLQSFLYHRFYSVRKQQQYMCTKTNTANIS